MPKAERLARAVGDWAIPAAHAGRQATGRKNGADQIRFAIRYVLRISDIVKVLVVEHQDSSRESLCDELSHLGFVENVVAAPSEQAAEDILREFTPDIVILDMQLADLGAFRVADRPWPGSIPVIVCVTTFERRLVEALSQHRVEYLVRPIDCQDLHYVMTRQRRPDPIDPRLNLKRLLDAAISLQYPVRSRIAVWRRGKSHIVDTAEIAAIYHDGKGFHLWTPAGVYKAAGPCVEIENSVRSSMFRRLYANGLISSDSMRFGRELRRAHWWLRRHQLADLVLKRRSTAMTAGR